jgi:hypothetical protein
LLRKIDPMTLHGYHPNCQQGIQALKGEGPSCCAREQMKQASNTSDWLARERKNVYETV